MMILRPIQSDSTETRQDFRAVPARIASRERWARRHRWLTLRARVFGRRQSRLPENRACQSSRSVSVILRKVTSGTAKA